jgi:hypothetical protein
MNSTDMHTAETSLEDLFFFSPDVHLVDDIPDPGEDFHQDNFNEDDDGDDSINDDDDDGGVIVDDETSSNPNLFDFDDVLDHHPDLSQALSSSSIRIHAPQLPGLAKRKPRAFLRAYLTTIEAVEKILGDKCPCSKKPAGRNCLSLFKPNEVWELRARRWSLSAQEDQRTRLTELSAGLQVNQLHPRMLVMGKNICLQAYCNVFGYNRTSVSRTLSSARKGLGMAPVGRPKNPDKGKDALGNSRKNLECYAWLKDWVESVGDDDPVGKTCKKVINFVTIQEIYKEYCKQYELNSLILHDKPLSERRLRRIWELFQQQEHVRIRRKANTTTKCEICDELHIRASAVGVTRAQLAEIAEDRIQHRHDIRSLRLRYMDDIQRSHSSYKFQTIVFDGTNSNTCKCPMNWRAHIRDEQAKNTFVQQKIQSVLIHGVALLFYVVTPFVPLGMNLTVSTLMDSLQYLDPRTEVVRFQYDGMLTKLFKFFVVPHAHRRQFISFHLGGSENVNYGVHVFMGLLIESNMFKEVYCNRLPPG